MERYHYPAEVIMEYGPQPLQVLVAGHSFVRRLRDAAPSYSKSFNSAACQVTFLGIGGATISGRKSLFPSIYNKCSKHRFDLIYLDLGSNDLDSRRDPLKIAGDLVEQAAQLSQAFNVPIIVACAIPRAEDLFPQSKERTSQFNKELLKLLPNYQNLHSWTPKCLAIYWRFLDRRGVHLNSVGATRYHHNVRACVRFYRFQLF